MYAPSFLLFSSVFCFLQACHRGVSEKSHMCALTTTHILPLHGFPVVVLKFLSMNVPMSFHSPIGDTWVLIAPLLFTIHVRSASKPVWSDFQNISGTQPLPGSSEDKCQFTPLLQAKPCSDPLPHPEAATGFGGPHCLTCPALSPCSHFLSALPQKP